MEYYKLLGKLTIELHEYHRFRRQGNVPQALACIHHANVLKELILLTPEYKKLMEQCAL